jgi:hypothetical protein
MALDVSKFEPAFSKPLIHRLSAEVKSMGDFIYRHLL